MRTVQAILSFLLSFQQEGGSPQSCWTDGKQDGWEKFRPLNLRRSKRLQQLSSLRLFFLIWWKDVIAFTNSTFTVNVTPDIRTRNVGHLQNMWLWIRNKNVEEYTHPFLPSFPTTMFWRCPTFHVLVSIVVGNKSWEVGKKLPVGKKWCSPL